LRQRTAQYPRAWPKSRREFGKRVPVHVKIHTGMSRYGVRWDEALPLIEHVAAEKSLLLEGVMTHFSQSDEADKTFANLQFARFNEVLQRDGREAYFLESCATLATAADSGFAARASGHGARGHPDVWHFSLASLPADSRHRAGDVREGPHRGDPEIKPGEVVGYGMRYTAKTERRIAILPIGYGDGFPRVRNEGARSSMAGARRWSAASPWTR
jgi:alanine racemase